ncbi:MAG: MOSC domain-containing protein, partial [Stellaceae bacterium]
AEGCRQAAAFFDGFLGGAVPGPLRIVEAPGHAFADARPKPNAGTDQYVSLINLDSVRALRTMIDAAVDPIRFRANLYFSGTPAWSEQEWIGCEIAVGGARLRVISPITRCKATEVNPDTAARDLDVVGTLMREFGNNIMGIYAEVIAGGALVVGDTLAAAG